MTTTTNEEAATHGLPQAPPGQDGWLWAAGFLSALGTFTLHEGRPLLIVKSSRDLESITRFASVISANANACTINGKPGLRVTVSGLRLKRVMRGVWPQLSNTRKRDYIRVRNRARAYEDAGEEVRAAA